MSMIERQARRARTRLTLNVLFGRAALGILVAACVWQLVLLAERILGLGIPFWPSVAAAGLLAGLIACLGTVLSRVSLLSAAVALDKAAGLKERLSTGLLCAATAGSDPFARAAIADAERVGGGVHVASHLPFRASPLWPWTLAIVLSAALTSFFLKPMNLLAALKDEPAAGQSVQARQEQEAVSAEVNKKFEELREVAKSNPLLEEVVPELDALDLADKPLETPDDVRREAVKRIDNVADKLAKQKETVELDALKEMKRMLAQLKPQQGSNAAADLSQALAAGDFESAEKALQEMKAQIDQAARTGDPAKKQQAADLKRKLDELAKQLEQVADDKQLQKELENKAGMSPEDAQKLLKQLSQTDPKQLEKELQKRLGDSGMTPQQLQELAKKIAANKQAQQACKNLGQCLSQAAQQGGAQQSQNGSQGAQGEGESAAASLGQAAGQMSQLEMAEQALNELEAQLNDLQSLREGVCEGDGSGQRPDPGDQIGNQGPQYGRGQGAGIGKQRVAHGLKETKIESQLRAGKIIAQQLIDGPQIKGQAVAEAREALNAAERELADPVERQAIPRQYDRVTRNYLERLAGLRGNLPPTAEPAKPAEPATAGGNE